MTQTPNLKNITYRGGVLEFRIPSSWNEEYGEDGGGVFWDPAGQSGTLRLDILTFEKNGELPAEPARSVLESSKRTGELQVLDNGNAVLEYRKTTTEDGDELVIYFWEVANFVPPNHFRLAIFSHTILVEEASDSAIRSEIDLLRSEITASIFSPTLGVLP